VGKLPSVFLQSEDTVNTMRIGKNRATAIALVNRVMFETGLGNFVSEYSFLIDDHCTIAEVRIPVIVILGRTDHNKWFISESAILETGGVGFPIRVVEVTIRKQDTTQESFQFRCTIERDRIEVTRF
jgi:hypothetical protein